MRKPLWTYLACCIAVFMISMDNLFEVESSLRFLGRNLSPGDGG